VLFRSRTWREDTETFRAQVRLIKDISSGSSSTINLAAPDGVLEVVRAFLYQPLGVDPSGSETGDD